jgi:hypothetical protein
MMRQFVFCGIGLAALGTAAVADSFVSGQMANGTACFARIYSPEHLRAHPVQRVTRIALGPDDDALIPFASEDIRLRLTLGLRDIKDEFGAVAYCRDTGTDLRCDLEGDAGNFVLQPAANGAVMLRVADLGLTLEGRETAEFIDPVAGDDKEFLLPPSKGNCP